MSYKWERATLGGGCFWSFEAIYREVNGVEAVESGYAGGTDPDPTYDKVCGGATGHAEVVQMTFDPAIISFNDILYIFWRIHDPTTLNRQGADVGTQYRSVIFYHSEEQKLVAERSKEEAEASALWPRPIVTEITPFSAFYKAESYHQKYYAMNANQPYCRVVIDPKLKEFRRKFQYTLKTPGRESDETK